MFTICFNIQNCVSHSPCFDVFHMILKIMREFFPSSMKYLVWVMKTNLINLEAFRGDGIQ